ncbi:CLUMA_CG002473, isoform A [Clunio marinus]|uniref:CLUMA_CG002473, isoform A n=1 Tax=Clunio marinus TaxID=568069 RepID=A0A1J1HQA6_9DIPT|nr:CLUMA_CG002473, isoform A [Clunio marinus]
MYSLYNDIIFSENRSNVIFKVNNCGIDCLNKHFKLLAKAECDSGYLTFNVCENFIERFTQKFRNLFKDSDVVVSKYRAATIMQIFIFELFFEITKDADREVFLAAEEYEANVLMRICAVQIILNLTPYNVFESTKLIRDRFITYDLERKCFEMIIENYDLIKNTKHFKDYFNRLLEKMNLPATGSLFNITLAALFKNHEIIFKTEDWNLLPEHYKNSLIKLALIKNQEEIAKTSSNAKEQRLLLQDFIQNKQFKIFSFFP